jgi:hypothetical protein
MAIEVRIPTILRTHTGGNKTVEGNGATLAALVDDLDSQHPGLNSMVSGLVRTASQGVGRPDCLPDGGGNPREGVSQPSLFPRGQRQYSLSLLSQHLLLILMVSVNLFLVLYYTETTLFQVQLFLHLTPLVCTSTLFGKQLL